MNVKREISIFSINAWYKPKKTLFTLKNIEFNEYIFVYRIPQLTVYTKILYLLMVSKSNCFFLVAEFNLNKNAIEPIEKKSNG